MSKFRIGMDNVQSCIIKAFQNSNFSPNVRSPRNNGYKSSTQGFITVSPRGFVSREPSDFYKSPGHGLLLRICRKTLKCPKMAGGRVMPASKRTLF